MSEDLDKILRRFKGRRVRSTTGSGIGASTGTLGMVKGMSIKPHRPGRFWPAVLARIWEVLEEL